MKPAVASVKYLNADAAYAWGRGDEKAHARHIAVAALLVGVILGNAIGFLASAARVQNADDRTTQAYRLAMSCIAQPAEEEMP